MTINKRLSDPSGIQYSMGFNEYGFNKMGIKQNTKFLIKINFHW